jgi:wyosine [tRNA(Phe)-imidazoG37] synthetase (radical SAM superfamily)
VGAAHLAAGGASVSFGHACEGEPLAAIRRLAEVASRIRAVTPAGAIVLRTSASSAAALLRAADAGVDAAVVALASAHGPTYERIHRPAGYRWSDVRAALRAAAARRLPLTIELLTLPGLTDRAL